MAQLNPINQNVLVLLDAAPEEQNGILIPEAAQKNRPNESHWGEVVAIGEKVEGLRLDDRVLVPAHKGTAYSVKGRRFVILPQDQLIARESQATA
jgi:co-chaperonin GroES (HSP10)